MQCEALALTETHEVFSTADSKVKLLDADTELVVDPLPVGNSYDI